MQLQCPGRNDGPDQELVADYIANMSDENLEQTADGAALPLRSRDFVQPEFAKLLVLSTGRCDFPQFQT